MIRGVHVLALVAIVLAAVALRATEAYATRYQSLPAQDWLESRWPLLESTPVPAAADLARGLVGALPLLVVRDDAHTRLPAFGPPAVVQRTMGGVRDAARIELGSPGGGDRDGVPIRAYLDVIVFHRAARAAAWADLMGREMDVRDPDEGYGTARTSGPDEADGVWVSAPRQRGGASVVVGHRGPVAFRLVVMLQQADPEDAAARTEMDARAELVARAAARAWADWVEGQIGAGQ